MSELVSDDVRLFFTEFERTSRVLDLDAAAAQFADVFLSADPNTTQVVPKAAFLAALPQRQKMFQSIGMTGMRLGSMKQTTLDDT